MLQTQSYSPQHNRSNQRHSSSTLPAHRSNTRPGSKPVAKAEVVRGLQRGLCKTQSCPRTTTHHNVWTNAWYCECCAIKLETQARAGGLSYFNNLPEDKLGK